MYGIYAVVFYFWYNNSVAAGQYHDRIYDYAYIVPTKKRLPANPEKGDAGSLIFLSMVKYVG